MCSAQNVHGKIGRVGNLEDVLRNFHGGIYLDIKQLYFSFQTLSCPIRMVEEAAKMDEEDKLDFEGPEAEEMDKLLCSQCEFLKFKNIDQWKNHVVGHWRLAGMTNDFEVPGYCLTGCLIVPQFACLIVSSRLPLQVLCFGHGCSFSPKDDNVNVRLSKLGEHFIEVHSFKQVGGRAAPSLAPSRPFTPAPVDSLPPPGRLQEVRHLQPGVHGGEEV